MRLRFGGLNLTVPLKEAVLPFVDGLTPEAMRIGAANTLVFRDGGRHVIGDNTDGRGFVAAAPRPGASPRCDRGPRRRRRLGACGRHGARRRRRAAASSSPTGPRRGPQRSPIGSPRRAAAARDGAARGARATATALEGAALVVNTTPLGLAGGGLRMRFAASPRRCLFVDLVYARAPDAVPRGGDRARVAPTLDGSAMLLHQGALAFEAWTGRRAPAPRWRARSRAAGLPLTRPRATSSVAARRPPTS